MSFSQFFVVGWTGSCPFKFSQGRDFVLNDGGCKFIVWGGDVRGQAISRDNIGIDQMQVYFIEADSGWTHWGRDKMAAIFQTTLWNGFSWMKMYEFRLTFHWSLFLGVQLTLFQHWFRWWLGADQATSHYLNQWWLDYRRIYSWLGLNKWMGKYIAWFDIIAVTSYWVGWRLKSPASTIVYSTGYSSADQRKHQSSASLAFVRVIHWWSVNSLHKWPVTRKMFPFDDVIMIFIHTNGWKIFM